MLKEALKYLVDCGVKEADAAHAISVCKVEGQTLLVKADGSHESVVTRDQIEYSASGVNGVCEFVKSLDDAGHVRVQLHADRIVIWATGGETIAPFRHEIFLSHTAEFSHLHSSNISPVYRSPHEMIRHLRTNQYNIAGQVGLLTSLDKMSWTRTSQTDTSGVGQSRANYGASVTEEVKAASGAPELSDVDVNIRMLQDHKCNITGKVQCFWEIDHDSHTVCLTPYGGELDKLKFNTMNWLEEHMRELESYCTVMRGTK